LCESTVRTSVKITSAARAAWPSSLAVPVRAGGHDGADASGGVTFGFRFQCPPLPPLPALSVAHAFNGRRDRFRSGIRPCSADGGVQTGLGVGLPHCPRCRTSSPTLRVGGTVSGVGYPLGSATWSPDRLGAFGLPRLPPAAPACRRLTGLPDKPGLSSDTSLTRLTPSKRTGLVCTTASRQAISYLQCTTTQMGWGTGRITSFSPHCPKWYYEWKPRRDAF